MKPTDRHRVNPTRKHRREGAVLAMVMVLLVILSLLGAGLLDLGAADGIETTRALQAEQAFWLAEAGVHRMNKRLQDGISYSIAETTLGAGSYRVDLFLDAEPPYAEAYGTVGNQSRGIYVELGFLAAPYENALWAGGRDGSEWYFELRGEGEETLNSGRWQGGADEVHGDVFVNGNVALREESRVESAPTPNTYGLPGDVKATEQIHVDTSASVAGTTTPAAEVEDSPDIFGMDYASNNTHNISAIFDDFGISSGRLPSWHPLYDVVIKNPSNRSTENASTPGDDYFFEPAYVSNNGASEREARTPLNLGDDRVYYVDGHAWFHHLNTYGFEVNGRATIVASRDIHISDNLRYQSNNDLLALVAAGQYDAMGNLAEGGNVYFGDPEYGTMFTADAFMFAAGSFLFNTSANTGLAQEPTSGFHVFGNFAAADRVEVHRDWYTRMVQTEVEVPGRWVRQGWRWVWVPGYTEIVDEEQARPARFDEATGQWVDILDENAGVIAALTAAEIGTLRHYQMIVRYDERIRDQATQPPGLPKGGGSGSYGGIRLWRQLPLRALQN